MNAGQPNPESSPKELQQANAKGSMDTSDHFYREYSYKRPWYTIPSNVLLLLFVLYAGVGNILGASLYRDVPFPFILSIVMVGLGVACLFFGGLILRTTIQIFRTRRIQQYIVLTESTITSLQAPFWSNTLSVTFDKITRIRLINWYGSKSLQIRLQHHRRLWIPEKVLASPDTIDRLAADLAEASGIAVEAIEYRPDQFSIRSILIVTTIVAVVIGLCIYCNPDRLPHEHLMVWGILLLGISPVLLIFWAFSLGRRPARRMFATGYAIGACVEWIGQSVILQHSTSTNWPPTEWYPLACPLIRMAYQGGASTLPNLSLSMFCILLAYVVSGILFGTIALVFWRFICWWRQSRTTATLDNSTAITVDDSQTGAR